MSLVQQVKAIPHCASAGDFRDWPGHINTPYLIPSASLPEAATKALADTLYSEAVAKLIKKAGSQISAEVARTSCPQAGAFDIKDPAQLTCVLVTRVSQLGGKQGVCLCLEMQ